MKRQLIGATALLFSSAVLFQACQKDVNTSPEDLDYLLETKLEAASDGAGISSYIFPSSLSEVPQDPNNPLTQEKVKLGKLLYHETGLAIHAIKPENKFTYSCASCHHAPGGFQACLPQGISEGGIGFGATGEARVPNPAYEVSELDIQPIRTPSVLNIAYQPNILWNGQFGATHMNVGTEANWTVGTPKEVNSLGYEGTEIQAIAGLGVHRLDMDANLLNSTIYKQLYDYAFPSVPTPERYDRERTGLAIAAYERTVLASEAPFQKWLKGNPSALTERQKKGAILFFGKANCSSCHNGPGLNNMEFHALGMKDLQGSGVYGSIDAPTKKGRGGFTGNPEDDYKFKVPQLYNLKDSPFFGHGGTFRSVEEVIEYKNLAIPDNQEVPSGQLADEFVPLNLSDEEIDQLTDFIENGLYDPNLMRYSPTGLPSGNCFPNNDALSQIDLGCLQ